MSSMEVTEETSLLRFLASAEFAWVGALLTMTVTDCLTREVPDRCRGEIMTCAVTKTKPAGWMNCLSETSQRP